jgi:hypothetical protein
MDQSWRAADQVVLNDGINSAFQPDQIGQNQAAWAANITIREGKPRTRDYKFIQRATLPKGLVQGVGYFSVQGGSFIASIWGQLWRILISGNNFDVVPIPLPWRNSDTIRQVWMCETSGSFLVQDGQSAPIIFDGASARRSNIFNNEVPVGTAMAYGNGRLAVVVDRNQVQAGNITTNLFQSELQFTETTYLSGGGSFFFPQGVAALSFLPVNNTDTGLGSLIVFGNRFVNSLRLDITARELWDQIPGFEQVILPRIGAAGQQCITGVNQDIYWRDTNGNIWSLRSAQWDALSPGNAPVSREVARVVDYETSPLIQYSSGIFFDNRLMFLASPFMNIYGNPSFGDIISLDAAALATMRGKAPPAYDGVAEGLNFTTIVEGEIDNQDRAFVVSTDDDGENRLWEIVPAAENDAWYMSTGSSNAYTATAAMEQQSVTSYLETRRYDFGMPGIRKQIVRVDLWPTQIQDGVTITVYWRADNRTQWQKWGTVFVCAQMTNENNEWYNLAQQERGRIKTLTAPDVIDVIDQQRADMGFGFQVRIEWEGYMLLDRIKVWAKTDIAEVSYSEEDDLVGACLQNVVTNNNISYSIPVGGLGGAYTDQNGNVYADQLSIPYTGTVDFTD